MSSTACNLPAYLTRADLARRWRVTARTIRSWEAAGKIDRARPLVEGSRILLFPAEMVERVEREGFPQSTTAEQATELQPAGA